MSGKLLECTFLMAKRIYETVSGRRIALSGLSREERQFLLRLRKKFQSRPGWTPFTQWWFNEFLQSGLPKESVIFRICNDLGARLGIAEGRVAPPGYGDYLNDLIEERYGSRYRFCKEQGVDPGHLSRVLLGHSDMSLDLLRKVLHTLGAVLTVQPEKDVLDRASPERASRALAGVR